MIKLLHGDCLIESDKIETGSVDLILTDLPYETTACKWDTIIPFEPLWEQYERIIKDNGIVALFGSQPFTTAIISSNLKMFKYCWYWKKSKPNGWQHSKNKPMTAIEEICIFSKAPMGHVNQLGDKRMRYNPQGITSIGNKKVTAVAHGAMMGARLNQIGKEYEAFTGFPHNVLEYANVIGKQALHPTQKPVELLEYLIKTYTNEGDLVLDNCAGSFTTAIACENLKRNWICIEKEDEYCEIGRKRIEDNRELLKQKTLI
ncbi:MAG TPA: site-specific DNA-methyltransferase [Methanofastidiosum sp.]|nr:site-specific DNA-methyltransferase [Methanofastidiosum sp.]